MKLVLASSSPRRVELLASIGIVPDHVMGPDVDESPLKHEDIHPYVERIARLKARSIREKVSDAYILSADTIVELGSKAIFKPQDQEDARSILNRLSGRRHRVYTGVCVISPTGKEAYRHVMTRLSVKRLSAQELEGYLASQEWEGKAGAYSIQGKFSRYIKSISGSYSNVVGLPLYETNALLQGLGFRG